MRQFSFTLIITITASVAALTQLPIFPFVTTAVSGIASWLMTKALMPKIKQFMLAKQIYGLDINKKGS